MIERHAHGARTIQGWLEDLLALARGGERLKTSGGAEPHRSYAYLEFHHADEDAHSVLLFQVVESARGRPEVHALRVDGTGEEVQERVDQLVHRR